MYTVSIHDDRGGHRLAGGFETIVAAAKHGMAELTDDPRAGVFVFATGPDGYPTGMPVWIGTYPNLIFAEGGAR